MPVGVVRFFFEIINDSVEPCSSIIGGGRKCRQEYHEARAFPG